jgi:hypothetical protein
VDDGCALDVDVLIFSQTLCAVGNPIAVLTTPVGSTGVE